MRVFIDANTYIKLFAGYPSKEFFDKLEDFLNAGKFKMIFPRITREEVYRGVSNILKEENEEPKLAFPTISKIISEKQVKELKKLEDTYIKKYKDEYKQQADTKRSIAKRLFTSFKDLSVDYNDSSELYKLASERKSKRYSPGKQTNPLGDQLVWEILLKNCTDEDLIIVSADNDWKDMVNSGKDNINPFILDEWKKKTNKKIELLENLNELIRRFEKDYKAPNEEIEKEKLVQKPTHTGLPYTYPITLGRPPVGTVTVVEPINPNSAVITQIPSVIKLGGWCYNCNEYYDFAPNNICPNCGIALPS